MRIAAASILLASLAVAASAQTAINDQTPCAVAAHAFDAQDKPAIQNVGMYIQSVFAALDAMHTNMGEAGIMATLDDRSLGYLMAGTIGLCRQHPDVTIHDEAAVSYLEWRSTDFDKAK
jgi:hypothetical protein